MHKTPALLRRWAAQFPGTRYPSSTADLSGEQRLHLAQNDPDLGLILTGEAPAELELAVMEHTLLDTVPSAAERLQQSNAARIAEILAQHPGGRDGYYREDGSYAEPVAPNMSLLMELAQLDQQAYQREELKRNPPKPDPHAMTAEQRQFVQDQMAEHNEARLASLQAASYGYGE